VPWSSCHGQAWVVMRFLSSCGHSGTHPDHAQRQRDRRATPSPAAGEEQGRLSLLPAGVPGLFARATVCTPATAAPAQAGLARGEGVARGETHRTSPGTPLEVGRGWGLRNDRPRLTAVVSRSDPEHSDPEHGALRMLPDGSSTYWPEPGLTGVERFTYTTTDAVRLYRTEEQNWALWRPSTGSG
jgi:hypothetical protein